MLRPEFVKSYNKPLSPDSFSNFGRLDSEIHNEEVKEATEQLHQRISNISRDLKSNESLHPSSILEKLHSQGKKMKSKSMNEMKIKLFENRNQL